MKPIALIILTLLNSFPIWALKYSGAYEVQLNYQTIKGVASYEYKLVDYKEVRDGLFRFSFNQQGVNISVSGLYKNNRKEGLWTTSFKSSQFTSTHTAMYLHGKRNGQVASKIVAKNVLATCQATFRNDTLFGLFSINSPNHRLKVQMDNYGKILSFERRKAQELDIWRIYRSTVFEGALRNQYGDVFASVGLEKAKAIVDEALKTKQIGNEFKTLNYSLKEYYWPFEKYDIMMLFSPSGFYQDIRDDYTNTDISGLLFKDGNGENVEYFPQTYGMFYYTLNGG